jgi:hypothetical protein
MWASPHKTQDSNETQVVSRVILFQETLEFKHIIAFYYGK